MPPPSSPVAEALVALATALGELGLGWYLFGAQAAIAHGSSRATKDIDVTAFPGEVPAAALLAALARAGLHAREPDPETLAATARVLPVIHDASGTPIDIVLAGPGLEPLFLSRAVLRDVAGAHVPVAAAEDVVAMKILAGRPHDAEDVVAILRARRTDIDLEIVRGTLRLLEDALAQSDLLPALEALSMRARRGPAET